MKKGNQWCFGMKAHIGVDAESGLAPQPGGERRGRVSHAHLVLRGGETEAWGDAACT